MGYDQLVIEVRRLLRAAIEARYTGDLHAHKVGLQAYADGYVKALCDAGLVGSDELLQLVGEVRTEIAGAAVAAADPVRRAS
jgi:hypothetical protein